MDGNRDGNEPTHTVKRIVILLSLLSVLLVFTSPITAAVSFMEQPNKQLYTESPTIHEVNAEDQVDSQADYSSVVRYFYENLHNQGVRADSVCAEESTSGSIILHVQMEGTDEVTRFTDAQLTAAVYAEGIREYGSTFEAIDRVSMEWPYDGEYSQRTMYIPDQWIYEYLSGELTGTELVYLIASTDSSYDQPYQPESDATCYPASPSSPETESSPNEESSDVDNSPEVPSWNVIEGNRTELQTSETASPEHIISEMLNASIPVESYRTIDSENDSYDDLQVVLQPANQDTQREQAKRAALIFAEAREQGFDATSRLFIFWPPQDVGPTAHMYIRVTWVDKYLEGEWSREEYLSKVLETEGSS